MVFPKFAHILAKKLCDKQRASRFFIQYPLHLLKRILYHAFIYTFGHKFQEL